jgi:hypothetical protein
MLVAEYWLLEKGVVCAGILSPKYGPIVNEMRMFVMI